MTYSNNVVELCSRVERLSVLRCAVLGAGGFIGTNLCRALHGRVAHLRAFGRSRSFSSDLPASEWVAGDFANVRSVSSAVSGCDVVFHLVTTTTPATANLDVIADLKSNVVATLNLLEACRASGVRRVVFVSSGGTVYGIPESIPTSELSGTHPICAYGIGKLAIEKYLALYEHLYGLEYRVLRVSNPYGPFQLASKNQGVVAAFLLKAMSNLPIEIWGDGSVTRDYIYINDVIQSLLLAATHVGDARVLNISSATGRTLADLVNAIGDLLGRELEVCYGAHRPVDVPVSILDNTLARLELDWAPQVSFEDGLKATLSWLQSDQVRRSLLLRPWTLALWPR